MSNLHGTSVEEAIVDSLSNEISREIDMQITNKKMKDAFRSLKAGYSIKSTDDWINIHAKRYTEEEFIKEHLGGLTMEQITDCLKDKYPENFI